jgi:ABC-type multidrug transport system ATPase subunit
VSPEKAKVMKSLILTIQKHISKDLYFSFKSNTLEKAFKMIIKDTSLQSINHEIGSVESIMERMYTNHSSSFRDILMLIVKAKFRFVFSLKVEYTKIFYTSFMSPLDFCICFSRICEMKSFKDEDFIKYMLTLMLLTQMSFDTFSVANYVHNKNCGLLSLLYINRISATAYYFGNFLFDYLLITLQDSSRYLLSTLVLSDTPNDCGALKNQILLSLYYLYAWRVAYSCSVAVYYRLIFNSKNSSYFVFLYPILGGIFLFLSNHVSKYFCYVNETALMMRLIENPDEMTPEYLLLLFVIGATHLVLAIIIDEYALRNNFKISKKEKAGEAATGATNEDIKPQNSLILNTKTPFKEEFDITYVADSEIIQVRALTKKYSRNITELNEVTFSIDKKIHFGLVGPNGAGKSTIINILLGAIRKTSGSIKFGQSNRDSGWMSSMPGPNPFKDCRVAACFQGDFFWPNLTVKENLSFFMILHNIQPIPLFEMIQYFELGQYYDTKAQLLSSGNKRKLCILMSLLINPDVIIFDEATCGVDFSAKIKLRKILSYFKRKNEAIALMSTHFLSDIETFCDKIGIIVNGEFQCIEFLNVLKASLGGYSAYLSFSSLVSREATLVELSRLATVELLFNNPKQLTVDCRLNNIEDPVELLLCLLRAEESRSLLEFSIHEFSIEDIYTYLLRNKKSVLD